MPFEMPLDISSQTDKKFTKFEGKQFEVENPGTLSEGDINSGDRVFISTESGNRYMLRRSKSAGGQIKIYNEKADNFKLGYILAAQGEIAKVGDPFEFIVRISKDKGQKHNSTKVVGIEIRRGVDDVIENSKRDKRSGAFSSMSDMIIKQTSHAKEKVDLDNL